MRLEFMEEIVDRDNLFRSHKHIGIQGHALE